MRIILYTGKGGVGKTSIAASTAYKSANLGKKTLIVSTDAAHSLGDSLDRKLQAEPVKVEENLWAQEIDSIHEMEKGWGKVQDYFTSLFTAKAVKDITTEELTVFPGFEDLLSLLTILDHYKSGSYDVIVVDCAPTGETFALLSFPELLSWWMDKLFPLKKKAIKVMRPVLEPLTGVPMPSNGVMDEIEKIYAQLDEMREVFSNREVTSIRIVANPEKMVIKEARRSFTYLNIYNFNVDAIIVNKVLPQTLKEDYFKGWKEIQQQYIREVEESFAPIPIFLAPWFEQEVVGKQMLVRMGNEMFKEDPTGILYNQRTQEIQKTEQGYKMKLYMPFTDKEDLALSQKGEELVIRVGSLKRNVSLPRTLLGYAVTGAKFEKEILEIQFEEDTHEDAAEGKN